MFSTLRRESQDWDYKSFLKEYDNFNWVSEDTVSFFPNASISNGRYVMIEGDENIKDVNSIHPFTLRKFLEFHFSGYTELKKLRDGKCMLRTGTAAQAKKLSGNVIDMYDLGKVQINCMNNMNQVRGVIVAKELLHLTEDQIKEALFTNKLKYVVLNGNLMDQWLKLQSKKKTLDKSELPKEVKIVNFIYHPRLYIPGPLESDFIKILS